MTTTNYIAGFLICAILVSVTSVLFYKKYGKMPKRPAPDYNDPLLSLRMKRDYHQQKADTLNRQIRELEMRE